MAIDLNNSDVLKKLTLDDLIADAVERKDMAALEWLEKEANTTKERTKQDGTKYEVKKGIVEIRAAYIKKFLGYEPKGKASNAAAKKRAKEKKQKELNDKFKAAREAIKSKK